MRVIHTIRGVVASGLLAAAACSGGSSSPASPLTTAVGPIVQSIQVFRSDGVSLGTVSYSQQNNFDPLTVTVADLSAKGINTSTIDPNYVVLREANSGTLLGAFVTNSTAGSLTFTPTTSTRILWGMNKTNGTDYSCGAAQFQQGIRNRYATVRRLSVANNTESTIDPVDGDVSALLLAYDTLNNAWLMPGGMKLASITYIGDASGADMNGDWVTTNPTPRSRMVTM